MNSMAQIQEQTKCLSVGNPLTDLVNGRLYTY